MLILACEDSEGQLVLYCVLTRELKANEVYGEGEVQINSVITFLNTNCQCQGNMYWWGTCINSML
jgi:hypothetical protein